MVFHDHVIKHMARIQDITSALQENRLKLLRRDNTSIQDESDGIPVVVVQREEERLRELREVSSKMKNCVSQVQEERVRLELHFAHYILEVDRIVERADKTLNVEIAEENSSPFWDFIRAWVFW